MFSGKRYSIFFSIIFVYIVGSFIWWWWLLHSNNTSNFIALRDRELTAYRYNGFNEQAFYDSDFYNSLYSDYRRKTAMLIGEGVVFVSLISIGFLRVRNSFRDEIALTRQQNNFLLSITHELKSPLASLKLSMQTLQKRKLDEQKVKRLTDMSLDDINRLEGLVENILLASRMDGTGFVSDKQPINLSVLLTEIYERIRNKYKQTRRFEASIEEEIYINGDLLIFSSALYNLFENAVKYSSENDLIGTSLTTGKTDITLTIYDTGIGIPDNEKPKIFNRFYRVGNENTRTTKGTGLGLFIVKQVVLFHNGTIKLKDNLPKGTRFKISIPF